MNIKFKSIVRTRILIAKEGKSLREFAEEIGITHSYLSQLLSGKRNPSPSLASKISTTLGKSVDDIFLFKVVEKNNQIKKELTQ